MVSSKTWGVVLLPEHIFLVDTDELDSADLNSQFKCSRSLHLCIHGFSKSSEHHIFEEVPLRVQLPDVPHDTTDQAPNELAFLPSLRTLALQFLVNPMHPMENEVEKHVHIVLIRLDYFHSSCREGGEQFEQVVHAYGQLT